MTPVFGGAYAGAYDDLYRDKDYRAECDLIARVLGAHAAGPAKSVLDFGCGTGSHAIPLAERGWEVTGVDRSAEMLAAARAKAGGLRINFRQGDIRTVELGRTFDAALMMFAVLGYQLEDADVLAALRSARRHLGAGGALFFDVWHGPAVLAMRPEERSKVVPVEGGRLVRTAGGELDEAAHTCRVTFRLRREVAGEPPAETVEEHVLRYFFPDELGRFLAAAGFRLIRLGAFPDFDRDPGAGDWNVAAAAAAV
ncbi:MAG TPA: methyltransferase domain-containing protein [Planctomycetota bacterium]|nr:methyltransferase domain-containing protein [Planctomycetota bacterium]